MHQRRHRSAAAVASSSQSPQTAAATPSSSPTRTSNDDKQDDDAVVASSSASPSRRAAGAKLPLNPRRNRPLEEPLPVLIWRWLIREGEDTVGTRKKRDDTDANRNSNADDLSMTWIITAVVCVGCLVMVALSLLIYLLLEQRGYHLEGWIWNKQSHQQQQASPHHPHNATTMFEVLPSSSLYIIPYSMAHIGDKSDAYAKLRREWDSMYKPDTPERSLRKMRQARSFAYYDALQPPPSLPYDIYNCPKEPPPDYPHQYSTVELLKHWPPSQNLPKNRKMAHLSLCIFDYGRDYVKALRYRQLELPFVVRNDPRVAETLERWSDEEYRLQLFGSIGGSNDNNDNNNNPVFHRAEKSDSLEFLYWRPPDANKKGNNSAKHIDKTPPNWTAPTKLIRMTYQEWYQKALEKQEQLDDLLFPSNNSTPPIQHYHMTTPPYYYYRLVGCGETGPTGDCDKMVPTSEYLFDELPFFQPTPQQLYLRDIKQQRGIHCRFGMPGVMAQNHFDSSRNAIVVLRGQRRYILSHPEQCPNLALYPLGHPSARHSQVNWTEVALDENDKWREEFPEFAHSMSNEVVLQAGDVLYLPTNWFHSIISLSTNFQCNTRSGRSSHYDQPIDECGFGSTKSKKQQQP